MNSIDLTKKLISITSYVTKASNENEIGEFIYTYLQQFPFLKVKKQFIGNGRFNVIAKDIYPTTLLWTGHMDTVQLQNAWSTNPLEPMESNGKIFGLGASDMKSGIAAMMSALTFCQQTKGLMLLFYADEEYDFQGIKTFARKYQEEISPHLIISGDGKNLSVGSACRGLIEMTLVVKGKTGHASRPQTGNNAIVKSVIAVNKLSTILLEKYSSNALQSTCNLAFLQGGLNLRKTTNSKLLLGREGNVIPDITEFVIEVRPSSPLLNAEKVKEILVSLLKSEKLEIENISIRHDLASWNTKRSQLREVIKIIERTTPVNYVDPQAYGYIDLQILWKNFQCVPCFTFGPGNNTGHQANEYVEVKNIIKAEEVYKNLLEKFVEANKKV